METKKQKVDKFTFEYVSNVDTLGKYGKYIYRNIYTNKLLASYESPFVEKNINAATAATQTKKLTVSKQFFTPDDVGLSTTALYLPF